MHGMDVNIMYVMFVCMCEYVRNVCYVCVCVCMRVYYVCMYVRTHVCM